jgi:hypothetical protein
MSNPSPTERAGGPPAPAETGPGLAWAALVVAALATAASVWLSVGLGLKACPLCYYQRTFAMGVLAVLAVGLLGGMGRAIPLSLLALPLAAGGLYVALTHVNLERAEVMECPPGLFGLGTVPRQSLAAFFLLIVLLGLDAPRPRPAGGGWVGFAGALVLGLLLGFAGVKSAAKITVPDEEYKNDKPTICRPIRPAR